MPNRTIGPLNFGRLGSLDVLVGRLRELALRSIALERTRAMVL